MRQLGFALAIFTGLLMAEDFKRTEDVVYVRKFGTALTMDVIEPRQHHPQELWQAA